MNEIITITVSLIGVLCMIITAAIFFGKTIQKIENLEEKLELAITDRKKESDSINNKIVNMEKTIVKHGKAIVRINSKLKIKSEDGL